MRGQTSDLTLALQVLDRAHLIGQRVHHSLGCQRFIDSWDRLITKLPADRVAEGEYMNGQIDAAVGGEDISDLRWPIALLAQLFTPEDPTAEIMVVRLDTMTRVHTFVEDIELSLDRDPIDVEVLWAEDGYAVKVTARSFVRDLTLLADCPAADATVDDALVTLPAGQSTTFRVRTSARNLEQVLERPPVLRTANDLQHTPSVVQRR